MAFVVPTLKDFRKRFPEFDSVDDSIVKDAMSDAGGIVGQNWLEQDYARGILFLAAHYIEAGVSGSLGGAQIQGESFGQVAVNYYRGVRPEGYDTTSYGVRFAQLLRVNIGGPVVV